MNRNPKTDDSGNLLPENNEIVFDAVEEAKKMIAEMLETAKKEAADIINEAKQTTKGYGIDAEQLAKSAEIERQMKELVTIELFKDDGKYKDDVTVGVNGKLWVIQRGVSVEVPRFVKEVLDNSYKQDMAALRYSETKQAEYQKTLN